MKHEHRANSSFILNALSQGIRSDGRSIKDLRRLSFSFGKNFGQVEVCLGKTTVFCALDAEMVEPYYDRPNEGFFTIHIDAQSSGLSHDGDLNLQEIVEISFLLEKLLKNCRAIDVESLCILGAHKVWSIRLDLRILNNDGNIRDLCAIAALAGISHFRLPEVEFDSNNKLFAVPLDVREPISLCVHHLPFLVTLGQFKEHENLLIVDPLLSEEALMSGRISIAVNQFGELCGLYKPGGKEIDFSIISYAVNLATATASEFMQEFQNALRIDQENRIRSKKNIHQIYSSPPISVDSLPPFTKYYKKGEKNNDVINSDITEEQTCQFSSLISSNENTLIISNHSTSNPSSLVDSNIILPTCLENKTSDFNINNNLQSTQKDNIYNTTQDVQLTHDNPSLSSINNFEDFSSNPIINPSENDNSVLDVNMNDNNKIVQNKVEFDYTYSNDIRNEEPKLLGEDEAFEAAVLKKRKSNKTNKKSKKGMK